MPDSPESLGGAQPSEPSNPKMTDESAPVESAASAEPASTTSSDPTSEAPAASDDVSAELRASEEKPTAPVDPDKPSVTDDTFAELGLEADLAQSLAAGGYSAPTPIQARAIPSLLDGRDVVGQAQTGTGKTAAFSLPLVQNIDVKSRAVQGLVLCPTRELALQVTEALTTYGRARNIRVLTVYGGVPIHKQLQPLRSGAVHVVVGTPGRVKDCIERKALSLDKVRHVVLDEADEMLRMGFIDDVEEILGKIPASRQTALFSATMPPEIQRVASNYLQNPVKVEIQRSTRTVERIHQRVLLCHASDKVNVLTRVLEAEPTDAILVFGRTRVGWDPRGAARQTQGVAAAALHGDMSQDKREKIVNQLRARKIQLVVATDVAARGLDVEGITHVVNFDPPSEPETYVHRIGRTGRAGREGVSILMLTPKQHRIGRSIERYTGQPLTEMMAPTNAELAQARKQKLVDQAKELIAKGGLDPYLDVIDQLAAEPDADLRNVAAAFARLAARERPLEVAEREPSHSSKPAPRRRNDGSMVQIFVAIGRRAGVRPADFVGAIANEAGIPGREVGAIDIRDKVSFIEVPKEHADRVVDRMQNVTIRGRNANFSLARPGSFDRGARPKRQIDGPPAGKRDFSSRKGGGYRSGDRPHAKSGGSFERKPRFEPGSSEGASSFERKPKFEGKKPYESKPYDSQKSGEGKKPYESKRSFENPKPLEAKQSSETKKPYEAKKNFDGPKSSEAKTSADGPRAHEVKKSFEGKKPQGSKRTFEAKKTFEGKKPFGGSKPGAPAKPSEPKPERPSPKASPENDDGRMTTGSDRGRPFERPGKKKRKPHRKGQGFSRPADEQPSDPTSGPPRPKRGLPFAPGEEPWKQSKPKRS
ncbi:MAG: DEAD/DEAH box helicase [Planctomycetota bacterium]